MKMNKSTQQEHAAAMQVLEDLCADQRIRVNDKLKEIFWQGVVHGWNRASLRAIELQKQDRKPILPKGTAAPDRDSRVDSAVGLSDVAQSGQSARKQNTGMHEAGVFRI